MAEGFARTYGSDVLIPHSAGLAPASFIAPLTYKVMREKNIDLSHHHPKALDGGMINNSDVVVNLSGQKLALFGPVRVEEWPVPDPMGQSADVFRSAANQIEHLVMRLILTLRAQQQPGPSQRAGFDTSRGTPGQ